MVRWYHLVMTAYGFWLPNDPRGSWSEFVRAWEPQRFGPATKTRERRSHAHDPHDRARRLEAKEYLARLNASPFFIVVDYKGFNVGHLSELRKRLNHGCDLENVDDPVEQKKDGS